MDLEKIINKDLVKEIEEILKKEERLYKIKQWAKESTPIPKFN